MSNLYTRSGEIYERALKVFPGGNTRITYVMTPFAPYAAKGEGAHVWDADGQEYLDLANNFFSLIHGHAKAEIANAIIDVVSSGTAFGLPTQHEVLLAEEICCRSSAFEQIRFVNSGTEAVMMAIKAARAFSRKTKIAKVEGGYHGSYDHMEVSLDSSPKNWGAEEPASVAYTRGTPQSVLDETVVLPFNDAERAVSIIEKHAKDLAAVIIDPMPSRVGMIAATREFLDAIRDVTRRHQIVLIFDEVISFRLDIGGAHGLMGVEPDLIALGKIIGGGLPIGAIAGKREVMSVFDWRFGKPLLPAGGTFAANPVTMAAGLASMRLLTPAALSRLNALGEHFRAGMRQIFAAEGAAWQVTGGGSLFRLHPHTRPVTDYRSSYPTDDEKNKIDRLYRELLKRGVLLTLNCSGAISTPTQEADIDRVLVVLRDLVKEGF
ncbi:MAG: aspartate aminotransferase family protein [Reyranellaceae bacterium]